MTRFVVETVPVKGGEKYQIRDRETGRLIDRNGETLWSNHTAAFGWASKCNAQHSTAPRPEPYRNPRLGG